MKLANKEIICLLLILLMVGCFIKKPNPIIQSVYTSVSDDTNRTTGVITKKIQTSYIIQNYEDSPEMDSIIFSHCLHNLDTSSLANSYSSSYYKETEFTNWKKIKENPNLYYKHLMPDDAVYLYLWSNRKVTAKFKYKDGIQIYPENDIKIEQIK